MTLPKHTRAVGKYQFEQLVAECFCAAVIEKQLRNNGLPVPLGRDDAVGGLFCHILVVKNRTIQAGGGFLLQGDRIAPGSVWRFSLKLTKAFSHGKTDFERKKAGDYLSLPASASSSHGKGLKLNFDPHPHSRSEALERPQGRVGTAALQFADVCLCNTGLFGQLLLGHPAALAGVDHSLHDGELRLQSLILCPDFRILQLLVQKVIEFTHGLFSSLPR